MITLGRSHYLNSAVKQRDRFKIAAPMIFSLMRIQITWIFESDPKTHVYSLASICFCARLASRMTMFPAGSGMKSLARF